MNIEYTVWLNGGINLITTDEERAQDRSKALRFDGHTMINVTTELKEIKDTNKLTQPCGCALNWSTTLSKYTISTKKCVGGELHNDRLDKMMIEVERLEK